MENTLVKVFIAAAAGTLVAALTVAVWVIVRRARSEGAGQDNARSERPSGEPETEDQGQQRNRFWSAAPEATYSLRWHVGESGAQGYVVVHRSDGRQVPKKRLPRESGAMVSELIGVTRFSEALQSDSIKPGRPLTLRTLGRTDNHPVSVGVWDVEMERQVGYLSPDVSEWAQRVSQDGEPLFCLSLWERWKRGERTRLKVLLLRESASFTFPDKLSPPQPSYLHKE